jgi:predicted nucleic acid-binding OB-fold protein
MTQNVTTLPVEKGGLITSDPVQIVTYTAKDIGTGIKRVTVDERKGTVILEGSAKVLQEQYREGITLDTFERVIDTYNGTGIIRLDPSQVMETGELFTVDVSKNMQMSEQIPEYISALNGLRGNTRYQVDQYQNDNVTVNGIVFKGKARRPRERMIFYDKRKDVSRDKTLCRFVDQFTGTLRAERNFTQFKSMRDVFGSNRLQDVLTSQANPTLLLFEKIVSKAPDSFLRLFNETEGMTLHEVERLKGRETIIRDYCCMDIDLVKEFIRQRVKGKLSRYFKEYREVWSALDITETRVVEFVEKHIQEIRLKLAS